jgi:integrase/recombinase XerD
MRSVPSLSPPPHFNTNMKAYIDLEEVSQMEDAAANLRDRLLIRLLFFLACRISELLSVMAGNIDFINRTVTIKHLKTSIIIICPECKHRLTRHSVYCPGCGVKIKDTVTRAIENQRMRVLPIDEVTIDLLKEYIQSNSLIENNCRIFNINRHRAWQIVRDCAAKAGLPKLVNPETGKIHNVSPHKLRDAFAVHAMKYNDTGEGMRLLQEHLGHQSFNTTAKYRKISGEEHRHWYEQLWNSDRL